MRGSGERVEIQQFGELVSAPQLILCCAGILAEQGEVRDCLFRVCASCGARSGLGTACSGEPSFAQRGSLFSSSLSRPGQHLGSPGQHPGSAWRSC